MIAPQGARRANYGNCLIDLGSFRKCYFLGAFKAARGRAWAHRPKKEFLCFLQENRGWAEEVGRSFLVRAA